MINAPSRKTDKDSFSDVISLVKMGTVKSERDIVTREDICTPQNIGY